MSFFDKINDAAIVYTFKQIFQRQNGKVALSPRGMYTGQEAVMPFSWEGKCGYDR